LCSFTLDGEKHLGIAASRIIPWVKLHWRVESAPHLWGCLKLELRGHFVLVQFHSGCDAAYPHVGSVVVVSP
jgi:hypothetical protein